MMMGLVIRQMKFKMNFDIVTAMARVMEKWLLVIAKNVNANGMYVCFTVIDCRFHLECAGLSAPPKGEWFCKDCKKILERERRSGGPNKKARLEGGKTSR